MTSSVKWRQLVNGTSIAVNGQGVLLIGKGGSGKSDLALRMIDGGDKLISDDVTELFSDSSFSGSDGVLMRYPDQAPANLRGRLEVRGVGIMPVPVVDRPMPLILVAELVAPHVIERLPEPKLAKYGDFNVALVQLAPLEASATAKLRLAVAAAAGHIMAPL